MTTLVALLIAAVSQAPPSAAAAEATHKQFLELETKLMGAIQLRTTATLEELVSPRFGFSLMVEGREPQVMNRSEWLRMTNVREIEIARLIGQGSSNKRIARQLAITERTVKAHLTTIFRKTGTEDRVKLALFVSRRH